jgi:hypothetical protein
VGRGWKEGEGKRREGEGEGEGRAREKLWNKRLRAIQETKRDSGVEPVRSQEGTVLKMAELKRAEKSKAHPLVGDV